MASEGLGHAPGQPAEVSLLACFEELLVECLSARSKFIDGQRECLAGDGVLKVPAKAARAWIRGVLNTPDQLRALDTSTLIECLKVRHQLHGSRHVASGVMRDLCATIWCPMCLGTMETCGPNRVGPTPSQA